MANDAILAQGNFKRLAPDRALTRAAAFWFAVVAAGQWMFAFYILAFYGVAATQGDFAAWNQRLFRGIIEGDLAGNIIVGVHLLMSFLISFCGPLQFIPQIRNRFRAFHRMNGRVFTATAVIISLAGLYLILTRSGVSLIGDISLGFNGVLIIAFAAMTFRYALARNIVVHQRWAMRLFLVAGGFLFGRAGFKAWIFLTGGVGHTQNYDGPFDVFWGFGMYLVPLAAYELYLRVNRRGVGNTPKFAMAAFLIPAGVVTALGVFLVAKNSWAPLLFNG